MSIEEGALLLLRRAGVIGHNKALEDAREVERALAETLAGELDGLPLAIDQAGAFIKEASSSLAEYLGLYRAKATCKN